jgi:hypothetical protein
MNLLALKGEVSCKRYIIYEIKNGCGNSSIVQVCCANPSTTKFLLMVLTLSAAEAQAALAAGY